MASKNFLLLSLEDEQAKKVATVVSNDSCRKILDYLAVHENATESALAAALQVPISTVHYNLQLLLKADLAKAEEFHYSEKGKEVLHYQLANKYIIITPQKTKGLKSKLRSILPAGLITLAIGGIAQLFLQIQQRSALSTPNAMDGAVQQMAKASMDLEMAPASDEALMAVDDAIREPVTESFFSTLSSSPVFWFIVGALVALLVYVLWSWYRNRETKE
ncbi:helix-turn-helix transcriptional regulator [Candidatus Woesearchaeota archaeon]|nr:helix-turn-helix transcriptional regulator [Candidatus Woesearchaeota archaeon]